VVQHLDHLAGGSVSGERGEPARSANSTRPNGSSSRRGGAEGGDGREAGGEEQPHPRRDREPRGHVLEQDARRRARAAQGTLRWPAAHMETKKVRASSRRAAASPAANPSATFAAATERTNQKWEGWCSHRRLSCGSASSRAKAANGSASTVTHNSSRRLTVRAAGERGGRPRLSPCVSSGSRLSVMLIDLHGGEPERSPHHPKGGQQEAIPADDDFGCMGLGSPGAATGLEGP
jgi:hypothetical protein